MEVAQEKHRYMASVVLGLAVAVVLFGFYILSHRNYLLFHCLVELFSIAVAWGIFMLLWNSRRFMEDGCFLLVGISFLYVGIVDLLHTLAYSGMGVFPGAGSNLATQMWIIARYMQSVSLMGAPLMLQRRVKPGFLFAVYAFVSLLTLLSVFYWGVFPDCYVEGRGLTQFKVVSEYVICVVLFVKS